jgi:hypothetical protein
MSSVLIFEYKYNKEYNMLWKISSEASQSSLALSPAGAWLTCRVSELEKTRNHLSPFLIA